VTLQGSVKDLRAHGSVALVPSRYAMGVQGTLRANADFVYAPRQSTVAQGEVGGAIAPPLLEPLVPPVNVVRAATTPVVTAAPGDRARHPQRVVRNVQDRRELPSRRGQLRLHRRRRREMVVQVEDVSGVPAGKYYLGVYRLDSGALSEAMQLCAQTTLQSAGGAVVPVCTAPAQASATTTWCASAPGGPACIAYAPSNRTWTIDSTAVPVGAHWFKGDLVLQKGSYIGSFLATGDIRVAGYLSASAPNTVTSARACAGALVASNLCDPSSRTLRTPPLALGNAVLVAGSYQGTTFSGGDVAWKPPEEIAGNAPRATRFSSARALPSRPSRW